jgi:hypothetical protein
VGSRSAVWVGGDAEEANEFLRVAAEAFRDIARSGSRRFANLIAEFNISDGGHLRSKFEDVLL